MHKLRKNIVWLASYPKSGNTWFRVFLSNLLSDSEESVNINHLHPSRIASNRSIIDFYLGTQSSELIPDEIERLRPEIYRFVSKESETDVFFKTHDAWELNADGYPLFPEEVTKGVIYFIRNPLDVAVSFAFHNNTNFDKAIINMNDNNFRLCLNNSKLLNQIPQHLLSWSGHVISWVHKSNLPVHVMRFEDMIDKPERTFSKALEFLKISFTDKQLFHALQKSSFERLSIQEAEFGFKEKYIFSKKFFRSGTRNNWKQYLEQKQVYKIINHHRIIMKEFGYLDEFA